jgi:dihydroorotase-like cyclic amidohydrolase
MINVVRLLCTGPAEIVNLGKKKGKIQSKMDADFVVWNPFEGFEFDLE